MKTFSDYLYLEDADDYDTHKNSSTRISRQHIPISNFAWNIIEDDMYAIHNNDISKSKMFNNIITVFHEHSPANLDAFAEKEAATLKKALKKLKTADMDNIINSIIKEKIDSQKDKYTNYPKGVQDKLYLTQATHKLLQGIPDTSYIATIYKRPGKYITALLETYAELPFYKREQICLNELIEELSYSIEKGCLCQFKAGTISFNAFPRKICTDKNLLYNYVICEDEEGAFRSTRLCNITSINRTIAKKLFTTDRLDELNSLIALKDVPFIHSNNTHIKVKFTEAGLKLYRSIAHQRPHILKAENDFYFFDCSETQAKFYFQRFGKDAIVFEPAHLRGEIQHHYKCACDTYSEE